MQLKHKSNTFLDFIKNKYKEKVYNIDNKEKAKIIDNKESIKQIYNKEKINNIDNKEKIKINDNNDNTKIIIENKELNNSLLIKKNEEYKNKINELENIIKELKIQLIEKDKLLKEEKIKNDNLNEKIKEFEIISNDRTKTNNITELENEIKLFRTYYNFSPNEKLISIKFISNNQDIDFTIITKNSDDFSKIEKILYDKYPKYKDSENSFLANGNKINKDRTLEENKIRNNDILTLEINNFD